MGCSPWGHKESGTTERLTLTYFLTHHLRGFPAGSVVKESACHAGDLCSTPESGRSPWRREWLLNPVFLRGESHGQRSLVGCSPWGRKESGTTERLTLTLTLINKSVELCSFKALPHMLFHIAFTRKDVMEVERRTGRTLLL